MGVSAQGKALGINSSFHPLPEAAVQGLKGRILPDGMIEADAPLQLQRPPGGGLLQHRQARPPLVVKQELHGKIPAQGLAPAKAVLQERRQDPVDLLRIREGQSLLHAPAYHLDGRHLLPLMLRQDPHGDHVV